MAKAKDACAELRMELEKIRQQLKDALMENEHLKCRIRELERGSVPFGVQRRQMGM